MTLQAFHIGVKAVIVADGRVLLLKREDGWSGTFWEFPGGRMEEGEEIEQTLRRELREELPGIARVEIGPLLHAGRTSQDWEGIGLVLLFYRVRATFSALTLSDEHLGHTWADAADLTTLEHGQGDGAIFAYTLVAARAAFATARAD